jgi:hypothetical protein
MIPPISLTSPFAQSFPIKCRSQRSKEGMLVRLSQLDKLEKLEKLAVPAEFSLWQNTVRQKTIGWILTPTQLGQRFNGSTRIL